MLKIQNLSLAYGKKAILKDISVSINRSHSLTILGANGSGKSSLAKAISGLIDFTGTIKINNEDIKSLTAKQKARLIAYIPAKLEGIDPHISVSEFVLMGRFSHLERFSQYSMKDEKKVDDVLTQLKLHPFKEQELSTLSSGEQQLVLIAQALVQESPLLIFDEPTSHLDPKNVVRFVELFKKLKRDYTLILITHDIHLAQALNQEILFIQEGKSFHYQENFFTKETLFKHYGVPFSISKEHMGLCYD